MLESIAAGIVLFNPQKERFEESLDHLKEQVGTIYIFDNSAASTDSYDESMANCL